MTDKNYQICTKCIMDTSDPEIVFDARGVCNHCYNFDKVIQPLWYPNEQGKKIIDSTFAEIKRSQADKEYDCIIGLSGGVDSSYLAYVAHQYNLRPLVVHIDTGWNSELAVQNIESIVKTLGYDLYTDVIDWEEMRDLQLAFFRSGVANQDVPQDHAIFAGLYKFAIENKIKYVFSGSNYATESILPTAWGYSAMDSTHIRAIHKRFGSQPLASYPLVGLFRYHIYYPYIWRMKVIKPLNWLPYTKSHAMKVLENELGWKYYGGKHYESRFTKFFQGYYLPERFGYDKRRAHLSSLIVASDQITRKEALAEMQKELYSESDIAEDRRFLTKKLGISEKYWEEEIMNIPLRSYKDYPSNEKFLKILQSLNKVRKALISVRK